jgi:hypothetical protein
VRPFVFEGAEEALELAVPARRVRRDADVAGAELVERLREPVAGVALGVVAEDGLDRTAPCSRIQAAARVRVMETLTAFSVLCSSA